MSMSIYVGWSKKAGCPGDCRCGAACRGAFAPDHNLPDCAREGFPQRVRNTFGALRVIGTRPAIKDGTLGSDAALEGSGT
jgi:hypothetical protein